MGWPQVLSYGCVGSGWHRTKVAAWQSSVEDLNYSEGLLWAQDRCRHDIAVELKRSQQGEHSWTALITQQINCGQGRQALKAYDEMRRSGVEPGPRTFVSLLKACSTLQDLESAKQIHAEVVRSGFEKDLYVGTMLVDAYAKCGSIENAKRVFKEMPHRDVVSWTAMILGYAQVNKGEEALQLYTQMHQEGVVPNNRTYVGALKACSAIAESGKCSELARRQCLETVRVIHADLAKMKFESNVYVGTMLVDAYAKCGSLESARQVFDKMPVHNVVSWTALILGYAQMDVGEEALQLFERMRQEGVVPNHRTYVCVLKACSAIAESGEKNISCGVILRKKCLEAVESIHADVRKDNFERDVFVATMLVDVYAKCGSLENAKRVFESLPHRDVACWNSMIAGYSQMDKGEEALQLYTRMQNEGLVPDDRTYVAVLNACGSLAGLEKGKEIHAQILRAGLEAGFFMASSLIGMYGKCSSMVDARQVFDAMPSRDIVAWNALIAGYARQGESRAVFDLFERMKDESVKPNDVTFLGILVVCSHVGLLDSGQKYFEAMSREYGITPSIQHYSCMVDLLGRSGQVHKAMEMVRMMPFQPDIAVWKCVLGACQKWGNVMLARQAFDCAVSLDQGDAAVYVLMANIYAAADMPEEATKIQAMRVEAGAWKEPGRSFWIDMNGESHVFVVGSREHPDSLLIYAMLEGLLTKTCREEGYAPHHCMADQGAIA